MEKFNQAIVDKNVKDQVKTTLKLWKEIDDGKAKLKERKDLSIDESAGFTIVFNDCRN